MKIKNHKILIKFLRELCTCGGTWPQPLTNILSTYYEDHDSLKLLDSLASESDKFDKKINKVLEKYQVIESLDHCKRRKKYYNRVTFKLQR